MTLQTNVSDWGINHTSHFQNCPPFADVPTSHTGPTLAQLSCAFCVFRMHRINCLGTCTKHMQDTQGRHHAYCAHRKQVNFHPNTEPNHKFKSHKTKTITLKMEKGPQSWEKLTRRVVILGWFVTKWHRSHAVIWSFVNIQVLLEEIYWLKHEKENIGGVKRGQYVHHTLSI